VGSSELLEIDSVFIPLTSRLYCGARAAGSYAGERGGGWRCGRDRIGSSNTGSLILPKAVLT